MKKLNLDNNTIYVYIGSVNNFSNNEILPKYELEKINNSNNLNVIKQKKAVYGLLHKALNDTFRFEDDFKKITLTDFNKPISENYYFSISDIENIVAVAISNDNVGVDIEKIDYNKKIQSIKKLIMHPNENFNISTVKELITLWVEKEAIFKCLNSNKFVPNKINTLEHYSYVENFEYLNDEYVLAVSAKESKTIKIIKYL